MFLYRENALSQNVSTADLKEIGKVKMSEMKTLPFVAPYYKGKIIPREDMTMCKEFGGDCYKFVKKY